MKKKKGRMSPTVLPLYIVTVLFVALPLVYIVSLSFLERGEIWGVTDETTLGNYVKMLNPTYGKVFMQSFYIALLTTLCTLVIGYPFAYSTARLPAKWRSKVLLIMMVPFWLNSLIRLNGWVTLLQSNGAINNLLMNAGMIEQPLKLLYTFGAVMVGMVYALLPFMILAIYNSVEKMDWSLVEAARDLGAGRLRAFITVTIPQTLPGIVAGSVLVFVPSVGLFFVSDILGGSQIMLLGNLIKNELLNARNWPFGAALSVIMLTLTTVCIVLYKRASGGKSLGEML